MSKAKSTGERLIYWGLYLPVIMLTCLIVVAAFVTWLPEPLFISLAMTALLILSIPVGLSMAAVGAVMRVMARKAELTKDDRTVNNLPATR